MYDPKKSTSVWNFKTPSTRKTRNANQQRKKMAAYLIFLFFNFIFATFKSMYFDRIDFGSLEIISRYDSLINPFTIAKLL